MGFASLYPSYELQVGFRRVGKGAKRRAHYLFMIAKSTWARFRFAHPTRTPYAFAPPSTVSVVPVMYFAFALARNATAFAMSSVAP